MIKKEIEIVVKSEKATKGVKELNTKLKETSKETNEAKKSGEGFGSSIDKVTGGAVTKVKGFITTLKGVTLGFKSVGTAIAATGIGLLLIAIVAVTAAFNGSEEGQNKFAKLMAVISTVTGNVVDVLADLGEFIINLFSGSGTAMSSLKSFGQSIFNVIGLPIKNVIDTVQALAKVLGALFSGDIDKAFAELKNGVEDVKGNFKEAKDTIDGATNALKDFAAQNIKEAGAAAKVADQRAKADVIERNLIVDRAKAEREIADLRLKAKDLNNVSAKERERALLDVLGIQDKLIKRETEVLKLRRDAQISENTFARSNKQNLTLEQEGIAAVIAAETRRTDQKRQIQRELTAAQNEQRSERNAAAKEAAAISKADGEKEKERLKLLSDKTKQEITDSLTNTKLRFDEQRKLVTENKKLSEKDREDLLKKINDSELKAIDDHAKAIADLEKRYRTEAQDAKAITDQQKLDLARTRAQQEIELLAQTEEEKAALLLLLNAKFAKEQKALDKTIAADIKAAEEKVAQDKKDLEDSVTNSKIQALNNLSTVAQGLEALAGKRTVASKALAVATTLVDTYQSATAAFKAQQTLATPDAPIRGAIAAAAAVAAGLANVKQILSVKVAGQGGGSGGNTATATATQQPSFNLVGRSNVNQLRTGLDEQDTPPVRAFVVGQDVTSQQAADRSTRSQAAFG
jgi:hypothetical protein